ncbi:hypothetical protein K227x_56010 [Rubripirellula lacrimiformis]|uniref:Double-GTPase 2 domain-containing protein n=1 Tax=Rubripirellula lacrimiformis TaxID=1930273 RepID=A0A517NJ66_9BACT|nr:hypothetical protein [Rubripirellula lacrimiformis]QDT07176.1 hypothetical protein K227x_56010 [Rubripirellula lacrimiformis]
MIATTNQVNAGFPPITVDCACCDQRLPDRVEYCAECSTPASLSHAVAKRVGTQSFVSVLGASNAGKTVYLGLLLDILSKGTDAFRGLPTSAFSIDLQEQVITALEGRVFPDKTPSEADAWKWLHCQISMAEKKKQRNVDLVSPDFAGEAISLEIDQTGTYPAIGHVVKKSSGILILCDSMRVRDAGSGEDLFATKLASYIAQAHGLTSDHGNSRSRKHGPRIAIVFTKCDGCPEATEDPSRFAANNTSRLFEYCRRTFSQHAFFAASVAGSSGILADETGRQMRIPFHIQPRGIIEPLQWIVNQG